MHWKTLNQTEQPNSISAELLTPIFLVLFFLRLISQDPAFSFCSNLQNSLSLLLSSPHLLYCLDFGLGRGKYHIWRSPNLQVRFFHPNFLQIRLKYMPFQFTSISLSATFSTYNLWVEHSTFDYCKSNCLKFVCSICDYWVWRNVPIFQTRLWSIMPHLLTAKCGAWCYIYWLLRVENGAQLTDPPLSWQSPITIAFIPHEPIAAA